MKELFDWAYYGFIGAMGEIADAARFYFRGMGAMLVCLSLPIWFVPYAIYKRMTERG